MSASDDDDNLFEVVAIFDGDTFEVEPRWIWGRRKGNRVRPTGYDTPEEDEEGYEEAKDRLADLILGEEVELGDVKKIDRGRLVCDVFINDVYLAEYFPEYQV